MLHRDLSEDVKRRLQLQRRSARNRFRHARLASVRFMALFAADLATFGVLRGLLRLFRDTDSFGLAVSGALSWLLPPGYLAGWQFAVGLALALLVTGSYGPGDSRRDPRRLFLASALATALPLWMALWTRGFGTTLVQFALTTGVMWLGLVGARSLVDHLVKVLRRGRSDSQRTIFVGAADDCRRLAKQQAFGGGSDLSLVGFVDLADPPAADALGSIDQLEDVLNRKHAEALVVCGSMPDLIFEAAVDRGLVAGCRLFSAPNTFAMAGIEPRVIWRSGHPVVELTGPSLRAEHILIKRGMDIMISLLGLIVLSPLLAIIAIMVKFSSHGPVFFAQNRVGQGGRLFRIFKFRSMRKDAEQRLDELASASIYADRRLFKVVDDPRVTRIGRFLRRTSMDELPQLWNVLRGDMSLVGPRPPLPSEVSLYELHHYARFEVKPGMSGPWQVCGRNQINDFEQVVVLETEYIRSWTLWSDIAILFRTVPVVLKMRGAH